jgi:hypothetical protein
VDVLSAVTGACLDSPPCHPDIQPTELAKTAMEAERINQIANTLTGLKSRTVELRRYL